MAERSKRAAKEIEVQEPEGTDDDASSREALNKHIEALVALHADKILQEFAQRISDLEMMAQNSDAIQFTTHYFSERLEETPSAPRFEDTDGTPEYVPESRGVSDGGTPWY